MMIFEGSMDIICIQLYVYIKEVSKVQGYSHETNERLAQILKVSHSTLSRTLRRLQISGYLKAVTDKTGVHGPRHIRRIYGWEVTT